MISIAPKICQMLSISPAKSSLLAQQRLALEQKNKAALLAVVYLLGDGLHKVAKYSANHRRDKYRYEKFPIKFWHNATFKKRKDKREQRDGEKDHKDKQIKLALSYKVAI